MKNQAFWKSARILLNYKRAMGLGLIGAILSACSFGAGISMIMPVLYLLFEKKRTLVSLVNEKLGTSKSPIIQDVIVWLDQVLPSSVLGGLVLVLVVISVFSVIGSFGSFLHDYMAITIAYRAGMTWRERLYRRLIHSPLGIALSRDSGDRLSRLFVDTRVLSKGYQALLGRAVGEILKGVACLAGAFLLDWRLTSLALICLPVAAVLLRKFGKSIRRAKRGSLRQQGKMLTNLSEVMAGQRVVKVHNAEGYERRRFRVVNKGIYIQEMKARLARAVSSPVLKTLSHIAVSGIAVLAGWLIMNTKGTSPAEFITVLALLAGAANSIKPLSKLHLELAEASAGADRVYELLQSPIEPSSYHDSKDLPELPRCSDSIEFENITYTYPKGDRPAVEEVTLRVKHGQTVGIRQSSQLAVDHDRGAGADQRAHAAEDRQERERHQQAAGGDAGAAAPVGDHVDEHGDDGGVVEEGRESHDLRDQSSEGPAFGAGPAEDAAADDVEGAGFAHGGGDDEEGPDGGDGGFGESFEDVGGGDDSDEGDEDRAAPEREVGRDAAGHDDEDETNHGQREPGLPVLHECSADGRRPRMSRSVPRP